MGVPAFSYQCHSGHHSAGLSSTVIYNVLDFDADSKRFAEESRDFRNDLGFTDEDILILQPTRIVARKGIEQAIYLVKRLDMPNVKLFISHSAGDEELEYFNWVLETARQQEIGIHILSNRLNETRKYDENVNRMYSLREIYPHVDLVTYPSLYEGFDVIEMDGFLTEKTVEHVRHILTDEQARNKMVDTNFNIAKQFFSFTVLRKRLASLLDDLFGGNGD